MNEKTEYYVEISDPEFIEVYGPQKNVSEIVIREEFASLPDIQLSNFVYNNSQNWQSVFNTTSSLSSNWNSVYTTVLANSTQWGVDTSIDTQVRDLTGNWNSVYLNVNSLSSGWSTLQDFQSVTNVGASSNKIISIPAVKFDTLNIPVSVTEGELCWNPTDGTLDLGMNGGEIRQQIGQELFIKVVNKSGNTIPNGSPVYFSGRQGNRPIVNLARSDSLTTSKVRGLATQDIQDNHEGFITTFGYVRQIKTNWSGWQEGDDLYVSKNVAGGLTNIEPDEPHFSDIVGQVGVVGPSGVGSIFVQLEHSKTIQSHSDVNGTPLTQTGQILVWDDTKKYFDFNYNISNYLPTSSANLSNWNSGYSTVNNLSSSWSSVSNLFTVSGDTIRYRDSSNVERILLNSHDNLSNITNPASARNSLGLSAFSPLSGGILLTGPTLTGSQSFRTLQINQTWNTTGTPTALDVNITDTASNAASLLLDLMVGGVSRFSVRKDGSVNAGWSITSSSGITSNNLGFTTTGNGNSTLFGRQLSTSGGDFILQNATNIAEVRNFLNAQTLRIYNTFTDASNNERGFLRWASNVFEIGTEATGTGTNRALSFLVGGVSRFSIGSNGTATTIPQFGAQVICNVFGGFLASGGGTVRYTRNGTATSLIDDNTGNAANFRVQIGGTNNLAPCLKRSGSTALLQARLADDTDFAPLQGRLRSHAAATAETPTATHTLRLFDANGTEYRVLAIAV